MWSVPILGPDERRPILDWLADTPVIGKLALNAYFVNPGDPKEDTDLDWLRAQAVKRHNEQGRAGSDPIWTQIVAHAGAPDDDGRHWRLIAAWVAVASLRKVAWPMYRRDVTINDVHDVQQDMLEGFLRRLGTIPIDRPNIFNRLIGSAKTFAEGRRPRRVILSAGDDLSLLRGGLRQPGGRPTSVSEELLAMAADLAAAGRALDPVDLHLVARPRVDRESLTEVAAQLGLGEQAAYKRRQRAEIRIARYYRVPAQSRRGNTTGPREPTGPRDVTGPGAREG